MTGRSISMWLPGTCCSPTALVRLTYHYALGKLEPKDFIATWNFEHQLPAVEPVEWLGRVIKKWRHCGGA